MSLVDYLIKNASEDFVERLQDDSSMISQFKHFDYFEGGADKGAGVKKISGEIMEVLNDPNLLEEERERAKKLRKKINSTKFESIGSNKGHSEEFHSYFSSSSTSNGAFGGFGSSSGPQNQGKSAFGSGKKHEDDDGEYYSGSGKIEKETNGSGNSLAKKLGIKEKDEKSKGDEDGFGDFAEADEGKGGNPHAVFDLLEVGEAEKKEARKPQGKGHSLPQPPKAGFPVGFSQVKSTNSDLSKANLQKGTS